MYYGAPLSLLELKRSLGIVKYMDMIMYVCRGVWLINLIRIVLTSVRNKIGPCFQLKVLRANLRYDLPFTARIALAFA